MWGAAVRRGVCVCRLPGRARRRVPCIFVTFYLLLVGSYTRARPWDEGREFRVRFDCRRQPGVSRSLVGRARALRVYDPTIGVP